VKLNDKNRIAGVVKTHWGIFPHNIAQNYEIVFLPLHQSSLYELRPTGGGERA